MTLQIIPRFIYNNAGHRHTFIIRTVPIKAYYPAGESIVLLYSNFVCVRYDTFVRHILPFIDRGYVEMLYYIISDETYKAAVRDKMVELNTPITELPLNHRYNLGSELYTLRTTII